MKHSKITQAIEEMKAYITKYENNPIESYPQDAIKEFKKEWIETTPHFIPYEKLQPYELYENCLILHTHLLHLRGGVSSKKIEQIMSFTHKYDRQKGGSPGNKHRIYHNIGLCWLCLGEEDKALNAFKQSIFSCLQHGLNRSLSPDVAYKFTKCSDYLLEDLKKQKLTLSPPQSFNDPFDCPIIELLNHNEKASQVIKEAYHKCLTVSCFSCNTGREEGEKCDEREAHLNNLMWAHYADSHKGICIKYNFSMLSLRDFIKLEDCHFCFQPIKYSDDNLADYSSDKRESIPLYDSFFLKGESWKYEKEVRLIMYDLNGQGEHVSIPIPGLIEAIYFGLNCSSEDMKAIKDALTNKTFVSYECERSPEDSSSQIEKSDSKIIFTKQAGPQPRLIPKEVPILFYEMEKDPEHFGRVRVKNSVSLL